MQDTLTFRKTMLLAFFILMPILPSCMNAPSAKEQQAKEESAGIITGAERTAEYFPLLPGKRIAVAGNHSSRIGEVHLVDSLRWAGFNVVKVFSPEHGFRGEAADGQHIQSHVDERTGIPIVSLYGVNRRPTPEQLADVDLILFDIQDVGMRFYTYISTMTLIMQAAAAAGIPVIVLDRPNPHGHYVDGPMLDLAYTSFVGLHPIPVVHGMTIGEYARLVNGEGWLSHGRTCDLKVIPMENYTHNDLYQLPLAPSPNLPNMLAVYLYPSLCFFEGTAISVGRGTEMPFQVIGHPRLPAEKYPLRFTPQSVQASIHPPLLGQECQGRDLRSIPLETLQAEARINLFYLLEAYRDFPEKEKFFINASFDRLAGSNLLRNQIMAGLNEEQIRQSWQEGLEAFKKIRTKYLLYPDFE
ncbi:MAG: DUF1343 domain-containing protein [Bacteroidales bacterium]|nr:DUF1343 domain-containing protein [Bacteroidales bacterium]